METSFTEAYHRSGHQLDAYGFEDIDDDFSYSSGEDDTDSDYGADHEDNGDDADVDLIVLKDPGPFQYNKKMFLVSLPCAIMVLTLVGEIDYGANHEDNGGDADIDLIVVKDPGPFQYNKKMFLVSLPCAIMVLTLVGEIFLMAASFGAGLIIISDPKGEKKRCMILFTFLFVFCHCFTIYSVLPLLWLSIFNIFLIGVINMYVILTGGLCLIQFSYFRKHELTMTLTIEKLLFSMYPWSCVILVTWLLSSVISWELVPYAFLSVGFIYLQMFMTPHSSSFKTDNSGDEDRDIIDILPQVISLLMAIIYCLSPSMLHMMLHLINNGFQTIFSFTVFMQLVFIFSLSVFLTTLMSLRDICEFTGWQYKYIQHSRWISGAICTLLLYPVLMYFDLSSHFLPWLPAGIGIYAVYGAFLSNKKFKVLCLLTLPVPCLLFTYWLTWFPWKIIYHLLYSVNITTLYVLLLLNCVAGFLCVYSSMYWNQQLFESLLILQSSVFVVCEVLLYSGNLYSKSFLLMTSAVMLYTLNRLYTSTKVSSLTTTICSSIFVTKALLVTIYHIVGTDDHLTLYRCVTLFVLSFVFIRVITLEYVMGLSATNILYNITAILIAIVINTKPILHIVCIYVLWEEPTSTDIIGLCITTCGVCVIIFGALHLTSDLAVSVRQMGIVGVSFGVLILVMQPSVSLSWLSILQWGDVGSVILSTFILLTDRLTTLQQLFVCGTMAGICPGIRMATLLYSNLEDIPQFVTFLRAFLYMPACSSLIILIFLFFKFETVGRQMEKCVFYLCGGLGILSTLLLVLDVINKDKLDRTMGLPAWRLFLVSTGCVSVSLKILSTTQDLLIPLVLEDKKEKEIPRLPFIGNVMCVLTFLLACVQSPFKGFLHDVWCCGASLILLCLQKDKRLISTIKQENQIVPTIFTCILVLYCSGLYRTDIGSPYWSTFFRAIVEILSMLSVIPMFYTLWGILWSDKIILPEQVVVFLLPLNAVYLLYGSSYASQALGLAGMYAGIWMMSRKLPLIPHDKSRR